MRNVQALFREYAYLDRKRSGDGVTPEELQRLKELRQALDGAFSRGGPRNGPEKRDSVRVPTRLKVEFETEAGLAGAIMTNVSRGGLFVNTAFPLPPGTPLVLRIRIASTGERLEVPVEVVSNHVGGDFTTGQPGMGVRFGAVEPELRKKLDDLYAELGASAAADED